MKLRFLLLLAALLAGPVGMGAVLAQVGPQGAGGIDAAQGTYGETTDSYLPSDSAMGIPSGLVGLGIGQPSVFPGPLPTQGPDLETLQGCSTVGVNDYTSQLYNMPEIFAKFSQQDVNSELARQLLTYNYSMPQTAALFGQLNTYGNERYKQFQQGCSLTAQQADARTQYVGECVAQVEATVNNADVQAAASTSSTVAPNADELKARKTARAYEICTQQYNARSRQILQQSSVTYAETLRQAQDVNFMLRPLLCPTARPLNGNAPQAAACWPNLFLPQIRLQAAGVRGATAQDFGVQPAPLQIAAFLDGLRTAVGSELIQKTINPLRQQLVSIDAATQRQAAQQAAGNLAKAPPTADNRARGFMVNFLNCKNADIVRPLTDLSTSLNEAMVGNRTTTTNSNGAGTEEAGANTITAKAFGVAEYEPIALKLVSGTNNWGEAIRADRTELASLMEIAAGCAANQQVPFLDPILFTNLNSCQADDQNAFLNMASYDVAATASRNVLRYVRQQLQQALGRLEAGDALSLQAATVTPSAVIQNQLATAVRSIMLPSIEQQMERLNEFEATRGAFAKRVGQIYDSKTGCLFNR